MSGSRATSQESPNTSRSECNVCSRAKTHLTVLLVCIHKTLYPIVPRRAFRMDGIGIVIRIPPIAIISPIVLWKPGISSQSKYLPIRKDGTLPASKPTTHSWGFLPTRQTTFPSGFFDLLSIAVLSTTKSGFTHPVWHLLSSLLL